MGIGNLTIATTKYLVRDEVKKTKKTKTNILKKILSRIGAVTT